MDDSSERMLALGLSGGLTGALLGAAGRLGGKLTKFSDLIKPATIGAGVGGGLAVGSGYTGEKLLGEPDLEESNPYTKRGAVGGAALGGTLGAGIGAGIGSGALGGLAKSILPADNVITDRILAAARSGGLGKAGRLGLLGGAAGAAMLGYQGADEGMQMDVIENERRRKLLEDLGL